MRPLLQWFRPAPHVPRLSEEEAHQAWKRYRWRVFEAAFVGYALFYMVRNNLSVVAKEMGAALHYDKVMIGDILAGTAIAYGVGKLVMGFFSDRSDTRKFIFAGLLLTAACTSRCGRSMDSFRAWAMVLVRAG